MPAEAPIPWSEGGYLFTYSNGGLYWITRHAAGVTRDPKSGALIKQKPVATPHDFFIFEKPLENKFSWFFSIKKPPAEEVFALWAVLDSNQRLLPCQGNTLNQLS